MCLGVELPLRVWYPAASPGAMPATVLTAAEQTYLENGNGLAPGALEGIAGTATDAAPAAAGRHPVILLSHGGGTTTAFHAAQAGDLASYGPAAPSRIAPGPGGSAIATAMLERRAGVDARLVAQRLHRPGVAGAATRS